MAVYRHSTSPLKLVEKPDPVVQPGFVLIEVKAAGLCHSDVAALEDPGWIGIITAHPMYMGHEIAGIIIEVGEGVEGFKIETGSVLLPSPKNSAPKPDAPGLSDINAMAVTLTNAWFPLTAWSRCPIMSVS